MDLVTLDDISFDGVLILGLGETGLAAAKWCHRHGAKLKIADTRPEPPGLEAIRAQAPESELHLGSNRFADDLLDGIELVVLSPGLSPRQAGIKDLLEECRSRDIAVSGEVELFGQALRALGEHNQKDYPVLAVTGTNGKTTVTEMTACMIHQAGIPVCAAGNIGPSCLTALMQALDSDHIPDVWVLELSSFQIHTIRTLKPLASVVLNITQDHLDWHDGMQDYIDHKIKLLNLSQYKVINHSDPVLRDIYSELNKPEYRVISDQKPVYAGDLGMLQEGGIYWIAASEQPEDFDPPKRSRKKVQEPQPRPECEVRKLMPVDALCVKGRHNALNALAAMALARTLDISWTPLLQGIQAYTAAPHRMNFVRTIREIDFINDSKGTNVGATLAAISGVDRNIVLIMGGLGKGQDFYPLAEPISEKVRCIVLIGRDADIIADQLKQTGVPVIKSGSLREALNSAYQQARSNDIVLFSPACASMDMFKNYEDRGEQFVEAVEDLALEQGEIL